VAYTSKDGLLSPVGKNKWTLVEDCSGNTWMTTEFKLSQVGSEWNLLMQFIFIHFYLIYTKQFFKFKLVAELLSILF
jgi:hypothetical protein